MSTKKFNPAQEKAILHENGPLMIVAGAGTGKTTVITQKISHILKNGSHPDEVLALTFTEKAAGEMIERLDQVMPLSYQEPWVSTFHQFCSRILRQEALEIGLDPQFQILTQPQQWLLLKKNLFDFDLNYYRPLGNPHRFLMALITFFSRASDEDVSVAQLRDFAAKLIQEAKSKEDEEYAAKMAELAEAMALYQEIKVRESAADFGDLIRLTLELFRQRPSILKRYQDQFKHIMVDEFQDTNFAQYQLVKLLAPINKTPNLTVVGDDSQSIYRFRGAAISNILQFMDDYPGAEQVVLTQNYRSYQSILDGSYQLIQQNNPESLESKLGISKNLVSSREATLKDKPLIIEAENADAEVEFVVKKIYELLATGNYTYSDFAIIARANSQLDSYVAALKQMSLPYQRVGNRGLFDQEEIQILLQYLHVVSDPQDSMSLFQLLYHPEFKLESKTILATLNKAKKDHVSLWHMIQEDEAFSSVVEIIAAGIEHIGTSSPTQMLLDFVDSSNYLQALLSQESIENMLKIKNVNLFFSYIKSFEETNPHLRLPELMQIMDDLIEAGENPSQAEVEDVDAITLTTVHSAKGLEFANVFMVSLVAGRFPATSRRDPIEFPVEALKENIAGGDHIAEERRLFYVGMTRAKDRLFLSWTSDYGGARKWKPSGFLEETGFKTQTYQAQTQLSLLSIKEDSAPALVASHEDFQLTSTSYSQIDTFKTCPLKFKYRYVLKIPARPHHAVTFGQSVHETLRLFHMHEMRGKKLTQDELLKLYEDNFIPEGYDSAEHKQLRFEAGREALIAYFNSYQEKLAKPVKLEQGFVIDIAGVKLKGKIDRIDQTDDGYELIDYKTGQIKDQKTVNSDDQLSIYAMAADEALNLPTKSQALYFIEGNEKVSTTRTPAQLKRKRTSLEKTIQEMKTSNFPAKPGFACGFCEFAKICPYVEK